MGYVVPVGVETLAAPVANVLAKDFMDFLFPDALRLAALSPENSWAFVPFKTFCVRIRAVRLCVINIFCLKCL
jgi:hypothetical protein